MAKELASRFPRQFDELVVAVGPGRIDLHLNDLDLGGDGRSTV
jgi:hypothetical protein